MAMYSSEADKIPLWQGETTEFLVSTAFSYVTVTIDGDFILSTPSTWVAAVALSLAEPTHNW